MIYLDRSGRILDVNRNAVQVFGGSKKELLGKHFTRVGIFSHGDMPELGSTFANILAGKKDIVNIGIKNKRGQEISLECSASLMKTDGKIAGMMVIARDVTERKKMEEKLGESEERFRNLYESIQDPVGVYVGREGRLIEYNEAFKRVSGYTDEELKDKTFLDFAHPDDQAMVLEKYRTRYPREELPLVYEIRAVIKKGEIIPVEISVSPYKVKGKVVGIEVIHRDITERKKAEEKIKNLAKFPSENPNPVLRIAKDGIILYTNATTQSLLNEWKTAIGQPAPHHWRRLVADALTSGLKKEIEVEHRDRIFSFVLAPVTDAAYVNVYGRDVTERKQMEEKLRQYSEHLEELVQKRTEELLESEKRYSVLVEEASDGVFIGQDGKMVFVNKRGAEMFGYSRDELIELPFEKLVDEKYLQLVKERHERRIRGEKVPATYEIEGVTETGERVPVELNATRIHYQGRPATLVIVRDIRERKRMEEQRLKLERLAAIGELATMVGHDLRNPLQSIENATYYLNNELPRLPPTTPIPQKAIEMLQVINDSVNYADKIIRDLHDFSATKKPALKKTNINTIVKETLSQVETPENVELITKLGHLPKIKADKNMIKRTFLNLAVNGIQAMENGGTLKVSTKKTKDFVEVSFKDTGTGMSKENMKKLFIPFFTTKAKGMGMGLPICKKLVEIHGGSIHVESEEGKGTTFTVKLPIQQENGGENQ